MGNITSYFTPANRLARQFQNLSALDVDALVIAALDDQPLKQVEYILRKESKMDTEYEPLTVSQITLVIDDCYDRIRNNRLDDTYIHAVVNGVVMTVEWSVDDSNKAGELVKEGMENLLSLAARSIKGEACQECQNGADYKSPNRLDRDVHEYFVDSMRELVEIGRHAKADWSLSNLARYSLNKLCLVYDLYEPLQYLSEDPQRPGRGTDNTDYEEMWCHETEDLPYIYNGGCHCWDERSGQHHKYCRVGP